MSYTLEQLEAMKNIDPEKEKEFRKNKDIMRNLVSSFYGVQKLRISTGNRICASYRLQLGIEPGKKTKAAADKETIELLKKFKEEYDRITDAIVDHPRKLKKIIDNRCVEDESGHTTQLVMIRRIGDYEMMVTYMDLLEREKNIQKAITVHIEEYPIYTEWLKNIRGMGPVISAIIVGYFDIYRAKYCSSFTKYSGLDTVVDAETGNVRARKMKDTVMREYTNKKGEVEEKKSLTYNPFVKTKMLGVLSSTFIKCKSDYATFFYTKMIRLNNDPTKANLKKAQKVKICNRYMINKFYKDLFNEWRRIEGLPVPKSYEEEFLHMAPHGVVPYDEFMAAHADELRKEDEVQDDDLVED